jgi:predicted nucleotide-binding protein (sugar kinase/HSP70/actin superfamily)
MEKKLKDVFPDMFMLPVDFDSGVSDVNITNRMLLFIDNLKKHNYATANQY